MTLKFFWITRPRSILRYHYEPIPKSWHSHFKIWHKQERRHEKELKELAVFEMLEDAANDTSFCRYVSYLFPCVLKCRILSICLIVLKREGYRSSTLSFCNPSTVFRNQESCSWMTSLLLWATKKNCVTLFLCVQFLRGKKRSIYRSKNHILSPSLEDYIFPFPAIRQNLLLTHPFWRYFCPFCIYFTLLTSIPPSSFLLFPSHFPLFVFLLFIFFPQNDMEGYFPGGWGSFPIYTPLMESSPWYFS